MTVYRIDDPERIRAAADHTDAVAATADVSADRVSAADPGDRLEGPFVAVVRARLLERGADVAATAAELRSLAERLRQQAAILAVRIVAIEAAAAEAAAICTRWPELSGRVRGLGGLDSGWLEVVGSLRAEAGALAAREAAATWSG
ncbi:MAG: hypothetical protein K1X95_16230 [Acidimicrobiia bacterium]|nr:hypothetical protein [Acidimicrobiia bacterium]